MIPYRVQIQRNQTIRTSKVIVNVDDTVNPVVSCICVGAVECRCPDGHLDEADSGSPAASQS